MVRQISSGVLRMVIDRRGPRVVTATLVIVALAAAVLLLASGCGRKDAEGKVKVAASIVPLADFCRNVGGDLVEVETMIRPGASPHTYEPTASQMKFLSDASVFVYNGMDLEDWIAEIVKKVGNRELVEVAAADRVPRSGLIETGGGNDHGGEDHEAEPEADHDNGDDTTNNHEHGIYDPHVWLDPNFAIYQVEAIRDGLIKADPGNEETYRENARRYIEELEELDEYVEGETSKFTTRKFVSFHPAFTYYAHRYGLEQVGVIEELPGKEPSAGEIADLVEVIKEQGVQVIFTEPQFSPRAAEAIAAESGAEVVLKALDPLGDPGDPRVSTYSRLIRHNTAVMAEGMR